MSVSRRSLLGAALAGSCALASLGAVSACTDGDNPGGSNSDDPTPKPQDPSVFSSLAIDMDAWNYDETNDVYYQLSLPYCTKPATLAYESLSVYVPGGFMEGKRKGSRYSCTINEKAVVGSFTPETAPILMPINTGNLSAQMCPSKYSYEGLSRYLSAGCVYVYPGLRGRSSGYDSSASDGLFAGGSPWPVVDLKAAVRFLRYNAPKLPCDTNRVFVFGFSAGGGVALAVGAGGDCEDYLPYLDQIGAATCDAEGGEISDALFGAAAWCPQTGFEVGDAAYEWERGQWSDAGDRAENTWTAQLSHDLAKAYGEWVNEQGVWGIEGGTVTLDETSGAIYGAGSYADTMLLTIEAAATGFLASTQFPYTETPLSVTDANFPGDPNRAVDDEGPDEALDGTEDGTDVQEDTASDDGADEGLAVDETASEEENATLPISRSSGISTVESTIYATATDYIDSLNEGQEYAWLTFNQTQGTATVLGLPQFFSTMVGAEKGVGAFDAFDRSTMVNQLFGLGEESTLHFSRIIKELIEKNAATYAKLEGWDDAFLDAWEDDLEKVDEFGNSMAERVRLMDPMAFVDKPAKDGVQAPYWRINVGLNDTESPLAPALNLVLALPHADGVKNVTFYPVWGQGHVLAEPEGTAPAALIEWVRTCCSER